ncbi:unnamed protein product [Caretta caretta]
MGGQSVSCHLTPGLLLLGARGRCGAAAGTRPSLEGERGLAAAAGPRDRYRTAMEDSTINLVPKGVRLLWEKRGPCNKHGQLCCSG